MVAKKQETKELVVRSTTAVALPESWRQELAEEAKATSAQETPSVQNLSFRSGVMSFGGTPVPANKLSCIVIGTAFERTFYDGPFDPNKIKNPVCFALTTDGEGAAPHPNSLHPQHETCNGCPRDQWGSAGEGRRGKACKETRRLALIPADKLESAQDVLASELAMAKVPVTSVRNWSNFVHKVGAMYSVPFWAVVATIEVKPHIKNQYEAVFEVAQQIDDVAILQALKTKRALVEPFVMAPYGMATEEAEVAEPAAPPPAAKFVKKKA